MPMKGGHQPAFWKKDIARQLYFLQQFQAWKYVLFRFAGPQRVMEIVNGVQDPTFRSAVFGSFQ